MALSVTRRCRRLAKPRQQLSCKLTTTRLEVDMAAVSRADAVWEGDLMSGKGRVKVASGTFPEELIAAAHAACYSMAFSNGLAKAGHHPERLNTSAEVEFVPGKGITTSTI